MALNRNWVKTDGTRLEYAPTWLKTDAGLVINPNEWQYLASGWKRNCVQPPAPPAGQMVAATLYVEQGDSVFAVYDYEPIPRAPRVFSKLYLILALQNRGLYDKFKDLLDAAGLTDLWLAANEISEEFPGFAEYLLQARTALYLTSDEAEDILAEAVAR